MEGPVSPVSDLSIIARNITKVFDGRLVFRNVQFELSRGDSIAVTGPNGSGKTTLMKILAGVLSPTTGTVEYWIDGTKSSIDDVRTRIGYVGPYLQMYDEFTAIENLNLLNAIRDGKRDPSLLTGLLRRVDLYDRRNDLVRSFSSGMKQRLKYAVALSGEPDILFLDEPASNLDEAGIVMVKEVIREHKSKHILLLATNDAEEIKWCKRVLRLTGITPATKRM
jgi:heme exporter protein A